ncbi:MAG: hypothetical protein GX593_12525 [Actinomycetales bacterium]|nr:hypothetical protein [Actinomycetales bacterium]
MTRGAKRAVVITALAALALGGAAAAGALARGSGEDSPTTAQPAGAAASEGTVVEVTRGDLRETLRVKGRIDLGRATRVASRATGTVTWLPDVGTEVSRGDTLYRVDDSPVSLLVGDMPFYRALGLPGAVKKEDAGTELLRGHDVDLLADNLHELGYYDGPTEDAVFGAVLEVAVKRWQSEIGAPQTGVVEPTEVLVTRPPGGAARIDSLVAELGAATPADVLTITGTRKRLSVDVPVDAVAALEKGDEVTVTTADGSQVSGTVRGIGRQGASDDDGGDDESATVRIELKADVKELDPGEVSAEIVTALAEDVLIVPVAALLAVAGGGYALELEDHTLVPVTLGMVGGGEVEVSGVDAGTTVVVAS